MSPTASPVASPTAPIASESTIKQEPAASAAAVEPKQKQKPKPKQSAGMSFLAMSQSNQKKIFSAGAPADEAAKKKTKGKAGVSFASFFKTKPK